MDRLVSRWICEFQVLETQYLATLAMSWLHSCSTRVARQPQTTDTSALSQVSRSCESRASKGFFIDKHAKPQLVPNELAAFPVLDTNRKFVSLANWEQAEQEMVVLCASKDDY